MSSTGISLLAQAAMVLGQSSVSIISNRLGWVRRRKRATQSGKSYGAYTCHTRSPNAARTRSEPVGDRVWQDRKSTRLNSSHVAISYAVFCLKKKKKACDRRPKYETTISTPSHTSESRRRC